jgi:hypothetical protein
MNEKLSSYLSCLKNKNLLLKKTYDYYYQIMACEVFDVMNSPCK